MGLFSNVLNRVKSGLPQAIEDRRGPGFGIGSLMAKPDLEPRGGGFLKRAARNVNQQIRNVNQQGGPQSGTMLPIMPPSIPGLNIPDLSALQNISPAVQDAVQQSLATGEPLLSPERIQEIIAQNPVLPITPPPVDRPILQRPIIPPRRDDFMSIERIGDLPPGLRMKEQPDSNDSDRFYRDVETIRPDLLPPKRDDFMSIGGPGGGFTAGLGGGGLSMDEMRGVGLNTGFKTSLGGTPLPPVGPVNPGTAPVSPPPTNGMPPVPPGLTAVTPPVQPAPTEPAAVAPTAGADPTQTTAAPQVPGGTPYAAGVTQIQSGLDPLTEQLLFGLGGQGGFIPGAMRAAEKVFYDDQGQPVVIDEQVAGFSPDQLAAMQMQRQSLGMQDPYLQGAAGAYGAGTQALEEGLQRGRTAAIGALGATRRGVGSLQRGLGESADILRGTVGGYDPSMTERFYDPYEDRVVQQTVKDIMEQGAKADIGARAGDIARGGESAFGSRARLGAGERQEALGRGLAEAVSGIRSQGFREAQQTGLGEFARQKAAERAASTGLAGLAGQGFGGSQALAGALTGLGGTEQQIGQQRYSGQFGLGSSLQGLGAQAAGASASDIASLYGMGSQQQGQAQQMLDAQRRNMQQRQMTPLLQYQALAPFVGMAPAGQFQTTTQFAPKPSAMQTGIGTGLSAFGALGNLYGNK